jgi:hypothetical protein
MGGEIFAGHPHAPEPMTPMPKGTKKKRAAFSYFSSKFTQLFQKIFHGPLSKLLQKYKDTR